jgi:PleD family two-component response regulator
MKKILSIDNNLLNSKIIEQDIKLYFDSLGVEFEFFVAQDPQSSLNILNNESIDILFIDISSKHYNGITLLCVIYQSFNYLAAVIAV